jgi:hypothetical protein
MIIGKSQRKALVKLGYAAELAEYTELGRQSAGHLIGSTARVAKYQELKAVLDSRVAKPVEQQLSDGFGAVLDDTAALKADLAEALPLLREMATRMTDVHKVSVLNELTDTDDPAVRLAQIRAMKAALTSKAAVCRDDLHNKQLEVMAERTVKFEEFVDRQTVAKDELKKLPRLPKEVRAELPKARGAPPKKQRKK